MLANQGPQDRRTAGPEYRHSFHTTNAILASLRLAAATSNEQLLTTLGQSLNLYLHALKEQQRERVAVFVSAPAEFDFQPAPFAPKVRQSGECLEKADKYLLNLRSISESLDDGGNALTKPPLTEEQCKTILEIVNLDNGRNSEDVIRRSAGLYSRAIEKALLGKSLYFLTTEQLALLPNTSDVEAFKIG